MSKVDQSDLRHLLDLNDEVFFLDSGCWVKFEVKLVKATPSIPHGIRYSLTLHDKFNQRMLGYDNAHAVKPKKKKYGCRKLTWDHKHKQDVVDAYEFASVSKLVDDFWNDVETLLANQ